MKGKGHHFSMKKLISFIIFFSLPVSALWAEEEISPISIEWPPAGEMTDIAISALRPERAIEVIEPRFQRIFERSLRNRLPEGHQLAIEIRDIDLAGEFEPWRGVRFQDVRIIRSIYPPRISFTWTELDADGATIREGEEKLIGTMMGRSLASHQSDPLIHEQDLIRRWASRTFQRN
jgi:hypothetical protein